MFFGIRYFTHVLNWRKNARLSNVLCIVFIWEKNVFDFTRIKYITCLWQDSDCCCLVTKSDLTLHEPMDTSLPCPPLFSRVCSNSCSLSHWCYPTILSSFAPFSSCPQSLLASGSFPMSWLFASSGQNLWYLCRKRKLKLEKERRKYRLVGLRSKFLCFLHLPQN